MSVSGREQEHMLTTKKLKRLWESDASQAVLLCMKSPLDQSHAKYQPCFPWRQREPSTGRWLGVRKDSQRQQTLAASHRSRQISARRGREVLAVGTVSWGLLKEGVQVSPNHKHLQRTGVLDLVKSVLSRPSRRWCILSAVFRASIEAGGSSGWVSPSLAGMS